MIKLGFPPAGKHVSLHVVVKSVENIGYAAGQTGMVNGLELLEQRARSIPGSWGYGFCRYLKPRHMQAEDVGWLVYERHAEKPADGVISLRFFIHGRTCSQPPGSPCHGVGIAELSDCGQCKATLDVFRFDFGKAQLVPFLKGQTRNAELSELLQFRVEGSFEREIPLDPKILDCLHAISHHSYRDEMENIFMNAQTQLLLLSAIEQLYMDEEASIPACKFLVHEQDREKIVKARSILIEHIGDPITIRELSRKVAINECYLKKGFKIMYGSTIFDFYQGQRMEHARYLLYERGLTVTEVSELLGYSSISHFSTAFKKHTGLKPCELLGR